MRALMRLASACLAAPLALAAPALAGGVPPAYQVEYLGAVQGIVAMNAGATIVGNTSTAGGIRAWIAGPGRPAELLPLPAGMASAWANDVNDADVVVGAISPTSSPEFGGRAAAWVPDGLGGWTIHDLGTLPGHSLSNATALNNVGDIVGTSTNGMFRSPVLYSLSSAPVNLSATGIFDPEDVNDGRTIVDRSFTAKLLHLDSMTVEELGVPQGSYLATAGAAINEQDVVAGVAILNSGGNCDRLPAMHSQKDGWTILGPCGYANGAYDINDLGDVVMRLNLAPWVRFEGIGTFPIEDLIAPEEGTWFISNFMGAAINDSRQIAAWGSNPDTGQSGPLLLTPIVDGPAADLDGDGAVGFGDLLLLIAAWGPCDACAADLDGDGSVGLGDLLILLSSWS